MQRTVLIFFLILSRLFASGQSGCPVNIGFELGSFQNWECSIGAISATDGAISLSPSLPVSGRHTLIKNRFPQILDLYGGFPMNCPNGSGYSIQLGNSNTQRQAERVSYTFTIPPDQNNYSIIYNYAVVFQNPAHADWEQPKFTANVFDVTNGTYIGCSSFSYTASSGLPGFKESPVKDSVFFKPWTPVTIKLSGYAGKTIRLEFTTNDCTRGGHFGYAYIDVNQNCSSPISGNVFCPGVQSTTLTAPFGFSEYRWTNEDFSKVLGTGNTLSFNPVPPANTIFAVEVTPFPGQGCLDTIYTKITFSPQEINLKVANSAAGCVTTGVNLTDSRITAGSSAGLLFSYFTDASQLKYVPTPQNISISGNYYIQASNSVGCTDSRNIRVTVEPLPAFTIHDPFPVYRPATINLAKTIVAQNSQDIVYSYWKDTLTTLALPLPELIDKTGTYFIKGSSAAAAECATTHPVKVLIRDPVITPPNAFTPNGDGVNDEWLIPQLAFYPECIVEIFNRSGRLMFRSYGYNKPWDGKLDGKDLPVAAYYYVIKLNKELPSYSGSITIIK